MQGAAVLERLVEAFRLQSQGKMAAAAAVRASIPAGREPKERSINKAAQALESMLFQCGGLSTVTRVLEKPMSRAPVAALLPDHLKATGVTVKTQAAMAEAVREFLRVLTPHRGRRTDVNANAFWSVVAVVLPITTAPSLRRCLSVVFYLSFRSSGCPLRALRTAHGGSRSFPRFASSAPASSCASARLSSPPLAPAVLMAFFFLNTKSSVSRSPSASEFLRPPSSGPDCPACPLSLSLPTSPRPCVRSFACNVFVFVLVLMLA